MRKEFEVESLKLFESEKDMNLLKEQSLKLVESETDKRTL